MEYDKIIDEQIAQVIKAQKQMIRNAGFEPTWETFSKTLDWYQIQKKMSKETQERYEKIWNKKE